MISHRHWCAILTIGCCCLQSATAQEGTGAAGASTGGASSAFGTSAPNAAGAGGSSAFGTKPPATGTNTPGAGTKETGPNGPSRMTKGTGEEGGATGAASAFGTGEAGAKPQSTTEPTFSIPGAYGRPAQQFTAGEGRFARPKFRYSLSVSFGYDDNVNQTPTNSSGIPDQVVVVLDDPGTADRIEAGIGPDGQPMSVVVPGAAPTTQKVVIAGVPGQPRVGSFLTRAHAGFDVQFASRKTLFTFDLRSGGDWYWDRPGKDVDYTGSMSLMYLRRLTPRMQFTATVSTSTQTQPDLTQVNTSTTQSGSYFSLSSRMELSYRLTPRFSAVANVSYNALRYQESAQQTGDYGETVLGTELRYLFSPRFTLLGQLRYSAINYTTATARDAGTVYALLGGEVTLSRRFTANLLAGGSLRKFDESGESATSPYAEMTLGYQLAKATAIQFNGRYGFEAPPDAQSELVSFRSGLSLVQSFTPRLRGSVGVNYVRQTTTFDLTGLTSVANTVDSTIGFEYNLNRSWTLNANYTYITQFGSFSANDYYRNQIFVGAKYVF